MSKKRAKKTASHKEYLNGLGPDEREAVEAEIERLKKKVAWERMRGDALSKMIDIAEARFKIPVRMKTDFEP